MHYVPFGKAGFEVSRFGMGCMRLPTTQSGDGENRLDEAEAVRMIRRAVDLGVNYFDTAYMYHGGHSEAILGRALQGGLRDRVHVVTKLPASKFAAPEACLDEQLARLDTDHLDLYLLHGLNVKSWASARQHDLPGFLDRMKAKGKIRLAGFSFHDGTRLFKQILDAYPWDACQIQLNFLDENYQAGVEGLRYAAARGIPVVIMEPLKGGLLASRVPEEVQEVWDSSPTKRSPAQWAMRWLADKPEVTVVLSGASTMEQLEDDVRIFDRPLIGCVHSGERELYARAKTLYEARLRIACTACGYCMPCPSGVAIPNVFRFYNASALGADLEGTRGAYARMLTRNGSDASLCSRCGRCEELCPQKLPIIRSLEEAHAMLAGR